MGKINDGDVILAVRSGMAATVLSLPRSKAVFDGQKVS